VILLFSGLELNKYFTDGKVDVYGIARAQYTGAAIFTPNATANDSEYENLNAPYCTNFLQF